MRALALAALLLSACSGVAPSDASIDASCGTPGQHCCPGNGCGTGCCSEGLCVAEGVLCPGVRRGICSAGSCGGCGGPNEGCCFADDDLAVCTATGWGCTGPGGGCRACGAEEMPCCDFDCNAGLGCDTDGRCRVCGAPGQACCGTTCLQIGTVCSDATCTACGQLGQPCCEPIAGYVDACESGSCSADHRCTN